MQVIKTKTTTYKTTTKPPKLKDCPYCKSELTATEKDFFPCSCTFQACVNCYEDIMHNKGLCPSCHKPLRASRVKALHVSKKEELQKSEMEKLNREKGIKKCSTITVVTTVSSKHPHASSHTQIIKSEPKVQLPKMSFSELTKLRIIQRNLVYIIGLAPQIAKPEILEKPEYFGQYGKINKIVVNRGNAYNSASPNGPSFSAYITFAKELDASIAILAADQFVVYDRTLRTSYGTTKYCTFLLKGQTCPNPDCLYLHSVENREELLIKDENISNKEIFMDQQKLTMDFIEKHYEEVMKKSNQETKTKSILPCVSSVQAKVQKIIDHRVKEREKEQAKNKSAHKESNKENLSSNINSLPSSARKSIGMDARSNQDVGSANGSLSPTKTSTRKESKIEDNSEAAFHSRRSSSSNWSTTDCSTKKDLMGDHKEEVMNHNNVEQKSPQNLLDAVEKGLHEDLKIKSPFIELMESHSLKMSSENNEKKKEVEEIYKDNFDQSIYERITNNLYNAQASRFMCTQEGEDDEPEFDDTKLVEVNSKNEESEEFKDISRSIMEFVEANQENSSSTTENKDNVDSLIYQNNLEKTKMNTNVNNKLGDIPLQENSVNHIGQNSLPKTKVDKMKEIIQKGLNNSNTCAKVTQEDGLGLVNGKQTVNKSAEYNSVNKTNGVPNYTTNANIHTRNTHNRFIGQKLSSFK